MGSHDDWPQAKCDVSATEAALATTLASNCLKQGVAFPSPLPTGQLTGLAVSRYDTDGPGASLQSLPVIKVYLQASLVPVPGPCIRGAEPQLICTVAYVK